MTRIRYEKLPFIPTILLHAINSRLYAYGNEISTILDVNGNVFIVLWKSPVKEGKNAIENHVWHLHVKGIKLNEN